MTVQQIIDVGITENDGSGDSIQTAGSKINHNFSQLYLDTLLETHQITFGQNEITADETNANLSLVATAAGDVTIAEIGIKGTSISSKDSSSINMNEDVLVGGTATATSLAGDGSALTGITGVTTAGDITFVGSELTTATGVNLIFAFSGNGSLKTPGFEIAGNSIKASRTNDDVVLKPNGTGVVRMEAISINDNNILGTRTNENLEITASGTGAINFANIKFEDNKILGTRTNDDITLTASGTGSIVFPAIKINDNNIEATRTNDDIRLVPAGTGNIILAGFQLKDNEIIGLRSNEDINFAGSGTGGVVLPGLKFTNNDISGVRTNEDIVITPSGTGNIILGSDIKIEDNNIRTINSNQDINLDASLSGSVNITDFTIDSSIKLADNNITVLNSNADLVFQPSGTGAVQFKKIDMNEGTVDNTTIGATTPSTGAFTTLTVNTTATIDGITIVDNEITGASSNVSPSFTASGSGKVLINGFSLPTSDGDSGQILSTDGSKVLSFAGTPLLLGESTFADTTQDISYREDTKIDNNTAIGSHEVIGTSAVTLHEFATSQFDSAWYHVVTKDITNTEFGVAKYSTCRGTTSDGSSTGTFISHANIVKTGTRVQVAPSVDVNDSKFRLRGTGTAANNSIKFFRIGLGDADSSVTSGNTTTIVNADVDSASEALDTFAHASLRGAKYYISAENTDTGEVSNSEAVVVHNGSDAFISQFNEVNSGNNGLLTLTAAISGSNVVVSGSALTPNTKVRMYRIALADNESDSTGDNTSIIGQETIGGSATVFDSFANSTYNGVHYIVVAKNSTDESIIAEVQAVTNGSDTFINASPQVSTTGADLLSFTAGNSGSTSQIKAQSVDGSTSFTLNAFRINMLRGTQDTSTTTTLDSFDKTEFRSTKYIVQIDRKDDDKFEIADVNVTHDGSNAFISAFGRTTNHTGDLVTFTADISGDNVRLRGTTTGAEDHTIKIVKRFVNI